MKITVEHYSNDKSRTFFLEDKLSIGIVEIPEIENLYKRLLELEANTILLPMFNTKYEITSLLDRGYLKSGETIIHKMETSRCHENAAYLYKNKYFDQDVDIINGFALSSDGLWRFHSWLELNGKIIETTESRIAYFGFKLSKDYIDLDDPNKRNEIESFIGDL